MANDSAIEWTNSTWNPVTGCTKISPGCKHCYAERMATRLKEMGVGKYQDGFLPTVHPTTLTTPLRWKKPQVVFVNSMSDLFMEEIPEEFINSVFDVMEKAHWHTFQILTKRSGRLMNLSPALSWPDNVWMGVSVENADYVYRIDEFFRNLFHEKITH